jgi:hypothetical protein
MKPLLEREIVTEVNKHIKPEGVLVKKTKLSPIV